MPQVVPPPASIGGAGSQRGNSGARSGNSHGFAPGFGQRRTTSAGPRRRQSPLRQRPRQQRNRCWRSARPRFFRSSAEQCRRKRPRKRSRHVQPARNQSWTAELDWRWSARHVAQRHSQERPRRKRRRSGHRQRQRLRQRITRRGFRSGERRRRTRFRSQRPRRDFALSRTRRSRIRHQRHSRPTRRIRAGRQHAKHHTAKLRGFQRR